MSFENFEYKEPSITDSTDEEVSQNYVENLKLTSKDFDKKILDIGAGTAQFAKWAKEHHVGSQIYSLDENKEIIQGDKVVVGKAEMLPFADESFELVISACAIPHVYMGSDWKNVKKNVESSINEAMRIVKKGGEIRFSNVLMGDAYENQKILTKSIYDALEDLKNKYNAEVVMERMPRSDTYEEEDSERRLLAKAYLIIIKKPAVSEKNKHD